MTLSTPLPYVLGWRKRSVVGRDARNNETYVWAEPVDWPVFAIAPSSAIEPSMPNRDLSEVQLVVYAPLSPVPSERDRVDVYGETFEIQGRPARWGDGPWSHLPTAPGGLVVLLRRVEG